MLSVRERRTLLLLGVLYAAVVIPVGIRRGGDFVQELPLSDRLVSGAVPLYTHNPAKGVFWPPFTIAALVPFALVARASLPLSQALWAVTNVVLLAWSLTRLAQRGGWRPVVLAVAAVAKPLQGNFEHQNLQVVVLALVVAAIDDLEQGFDRRSGVWVGLATAVKIFPGLLLAYLAYRRRWRACAIGIAVACGCTLGAMLRYGPRGAVAAVADWVVLSRAGMQTAGFGFQALGLWVAVAAVALVLAAVAARGATEEPLYEVGLVTILAVLVSPIGWFYYHLLAIPAWVAALTLPVPEGRWAGRAWRASLVVAGVLLSGLLTFDHLYPDALAIVQRYNYVWGEVVLVGALAAYRLVPRRRAVQPA